MESPAITDTTFNVGQFQRYGHKRYELMARAAHRPRHVIDLAAGWGYFCHRFEADGVECTAIEADERSRYFCGRLRRASDREFEIVDDQRVVLDDIDRYRGAVLLLLGDSVASMTSMGPVRQLAKFVETIRPTEIYLETAGPPRPGFDDRPDPSGDDVVRYLASSTDLNRVQMLGLTDVGRVLVRLFSSAGG